MSEIPTLDTWREAFSVFERLIALDTETRDRELGALAKTRPDLLGHVQTLLTAGPQTQAQALINAEAIGSAGVPGAQFGSYRLESLIGSGGMGEVWLASRADGLFHGMAAVKLLHPYLSSSRVRERFAREGQILGRLSHPHIARLLDAGIGAGGALYLVLERIEGTRIDIWCDQHQLGLPGRVRLFLQVCDAVAYAHAHLIVHRDLKPSNILVNEAGTAKLLDFGIAKLLEQDDTDAELTRLGGLALTPEYAAPEQLNGQPVSTAADVYALGLLLHLLLSGRHPFAEQLGNPTRLMNAVRELDPPPMSRAAAAEAAAPRGLTPRLLQRGLRGDLDNIVAKTLRKAPAERYASVAALADDLRRYLQHEPVLAQPESMVYRTRKFLRRHWVGAAGTAAVIATLVGGIATTAWQAQRAEQQAAAARDHALRVKRTKEFFVSIFQAADPAQRHAGSPITLVEALDDALRRVDAELAGDPRLQADLLSDFGEIRAGLGDLAGSKALFQRALPLHEKTLAANDPVLANTLVNLGMIEAYMGQELAGRPFLERAVSILEQHADTEGDALSNARAGLGQIYVSSGDYETALGIFSKVLAFYRESPGPQERRLGIALANMGTMLVRAQRLDEARHFFEESVAVTERNSGTSSVLLSDALRGLFFIAGEQGDLAARSRHADRALAIARANFSGDHHWLARALADKGDVLIAQGRRAEGETLLRQALAMLDRVGSDQHRIEASLSLAGSLAQAGNPTEALKIAEAARSKICPQSSDPAELRMCAALQSLSARVHGSQVN